MNLILLLFFWGYVGQHQITYCSYDQSSSQSKYDISNSTPSTQPISISSLSESQETLIAPRTSKEDIGLQELIFAIHNKDNCTLGYLEKTIDKHRSLVLGEDFFNHKPFDYVLQSKDLCIMKMILNQKTPPPYPYTKLTIMDLMKLSKQEKTGKLYSQKKLDRMLTIALQNEEMALAQLLLELHANPDAPTFHGKSARDIATKYRLYGFLDLFDSKTN